MEWIVVHKAHLQDCIHYSNAKVFTSDLMCMFLLFMLFSTVSLE